MKCRVVTEVEVRISVTVEHTGRESVVFIAQKNGREIDTDRFRIGDSRPRRRLAERWAEDSRLTGGRNVLPEKVEAALVEKERLVRIHLDRGNHDASPETQTSLLYEQAMAKLALFRDKMGEGYVRVPVGDHQETHALRSRAFKRWLAYLYLQMQGRPANTQMVCDVVNIIDAHLTVHKEVDPVGIRLIELPGEIHVDLGDATGSAVQITKDRWTITRKPPVCFRRPPGTSAFPRPNRTCGLEHLRGFANVASDEDFVLLVAWLIGAYHPDGPYPILILGGEHGAAKSTTSRVLRQLVDPSVVPHRSPPRCEHELVIMAHNARMVALDNVSHVPLWLSDALCRLATGGGFGVRALFTDNEESLFIGARPIVLNGIGDIATRGDLLDRAIQVNLGKIPDKERVPENVFWTWFRDVQPGILAEIFDAVSCALRNVATTPCWHLPRMADFARWVAAAEPALGWKPGTFLAAYTGNRAAINAIALEGSPVVEVLLRFLKNRDAWEGTATELLDTLEDLATVRQKNAPSWPGGPTSLGKELRRMAPNLRSEGIDLDFGSNGRDKGKRRLITIRRTAQPTVPDVPSDPEQASGANESRKSCGPAAPTS